jgi:hypothetical protein
MPTFLTMTQVANRALATLVNDSVLIGLVSRDYDAAFAGKMGDTVNVRVPMVFTATRFNRGTGIQLQNPAEDTFPVVLDEIADVSFAVTSEDLTLTIDSFSERLLQPAMQAIVEQVEGDITEELVDAANQVANPGATNDYPAKQAGGGVVATPDSDHPSKVLIPARTKLGRAKIPTLNRYAIFSPEASGVVIGDPTMHEADKRGDTDGLREAAIGRKFGFDSYESNYLGYGSGDKGQADGVAFHRDAITLATRTLELPLGKIGAQAAVAQYKGLGLRVVYDYDITYKQTVCSVDFLYGTRAVRPQAAVELNLAQGS